MSTTLTPLRYPGGKTSYAELLCEVISLNQLRDVTLVEPFAGGAGASIKLLLTGKVSRLLLNDLDPAVYAFWWAIRNRGQAFAEKILETPVDIETWKKQRCIVQEKDASDLFRLGFATFYMNRCNRSGIITANPIGGIQQTGSYKIDARFNREGLARKVLAISERASDIDIKNDSCEKIISVLSRRKRLDRILVYFDPPYFDKGPSLYLNHYQEKDHVSLARRILGCRFNWVLSYDCVDQIRQLYASVPQYQAELRYTILGNEKAKELIATRLKMPVSFRKMEGLQ